MSDDDTRATEAYLQGLSGHPVAQPDDAQTMAQAEGTTLREALLEEGTAPVHEPNWQDVLAREAANEPAARPRFWAGLAASVVACVLAAWWFWPVDDNAMRGGGGSAAALWRSAQPLQEARNLASQLQAAGAQVDLAVQANGDVLMSVRAAPPARDAVNGQLAALDTALSADGHVQIRVTSAP